VILEKRPEEFGALECGSALSGWCVLPWFFHKPTSRHLVGAGGISVGVIDCNLGLHNSSKDTTEGE